MRCEPVRVEFPIHGVDSSDVPARPVEAGDKTNLDWIGGSREDIGMVLVAAWVASVVDEVTVLANLI